MDPLNEWVLKQYSAEFTFQHPTLQLSLHPFYTKGMRDILIKVKNSKTREVNTFRYVVSENGWELRQSK
jgi:Zn-dependent M32 family carboxypeptidase